MDRGTETFKGMCFVEFGEPEALNAALQMNGRDNDGRPMKIDWRLCVGVGVCGGGGG
jgi:RNA recognition motif-containing protein